MRTDHDKVIDWANSVAAFLNKAEPAIGASDGTVTVAALQLQRLAAGQCTSYSVLEVIHALCELEEAVLRRIDSSLVADSMT